MMRLAEMGDAAGILVGFADHLEATHFGREGYNFSEENMPAYLEEFDQVRSQYPGTTLGVEMEYYPDRLDLNMLTQDWLDRYRGDLDRVLGASHFVWGEYAVTWDVHMRELSGRHSFESVMDEYLRGLKAVVSSGMADCLPHPDVVFRGNDGIFEVPDLVRRRGEARVWEQCLRAWRQGMAIEVNMLGVLDGTDRGPSPSWGLVELLADEGVKFYVGSDSHSRDHFERGVELVAEAHRRLESMGARMLV